MIKKLTTGISVSLILLIALSIVILVISCSQKDKVTTSNMNSDYVSQNVYKSDVLGIEDKPTLRVMAVGDIMLGRMVGKLIKDDYKKPFSEVVSYLNKSDILFGNLESPISNRGQKISGKGINFTASPKSVECLKFGGFDVVSLANNHILDYNTPALFQTIELLDKEAVLYCGAGKNIDESRKPAIVDHYGLKVAFLAYTDMYNVYYSKSKFTFEARSNKPGVAPRKLDYIVEDIKKIREDVDIIFISLHWGIEESFDVSEDMVEFAHALIDSGADGILGHHPHQLQGIEIYKGKPIAYSLGNFLFDQNDDENKESMILSLYYKDLDLISVEAIPLRIVDKKMVVPAPLDQGNVIKERLVGLSRILGTKAYKNDNSVKFDLN